MPIKTTPCADPHCQGILVEVENVDKLAKAIALVLVQHYTAAQRILTNAPGIEQPSPRVNVEAIIKERLRLSDKGDPWHRDGLIFQIIMWLASHQDAAPTDRISRPHTIPAQKGIDCAIVHLNDQGGVDSISICEDKATEKTRQIITEQVWPEIEACERGEKDDELRTFAIDALVRNLSDEEAEEAAVAIIWDQRRRYRVRVTTVRPSHKDGARGNIFKDFNTKAAGVLERRRGETFHVPELREWMQQLTDKIVQHLHEWR